MKPLKDRAAPADRPAPPRPSRLRLPLATTEDVRRELARLYREARSDRVPVADASKLASILATLGRIIEGGDLLRRVEELEDSRA